MSHPDRWGRTPRTCAEPRPTERASSLRSYRLSRQRLLDLLHQGHDLPLLLQDVLHELLRRQVLEVVLPVRVLAVQVVNGPVDGVASGLLFPSQIALLTLLLLRGVPPSAPVVGFPLSSCALLYREGAGLYQPQQHLDAVTCILCFYREPLGPRFGLLRGVPVRPRSGLRGFIDLRPVYAPRPLTLLPRAPPLPQRRELLVRDRLRLRVSLPALGQRLLVVPDLLRRPGRVEEQQVRRDRGVGREHPDRQPHDGVQVELPQQ